MVVVAGQGEAGRGGASGCLVCCCRHLHSGPRLTTTTTTTTTIATTTPGAGCSDYATTTTATSWTSSKHHYRLLLHLLSLVPLTLRLTPHLKSPLVLISCPFVSGSCQETIRCEERASVYITSIPCRKLLILTIVLS